MRHYDRRTPVRPKTTMVEWMVALAILGILAAIILPSFMQTVRRAQRQGYASGSPRGAVGAGEGQDNTIELPATQQPGESAPASARGPGVGRILGLLIWTAVFAAMASALRKAKAMRQATRRGPDDHDAE